MEHRQQDIERLSLSLVYFFIKFDGQQDLINCDIFLAQLNCEQWLFGCVDLHDSKFNCLSNDYLSESIGDIFFHL